ncbi:MAG: SpoIIE family protein phosphatase [Alphaproteobacteria bacterium]
MAKGFNLDNSPAHLLRRATQYANDIYTREVGDEPLTARQFTCSFSRSVGGGRRGRGRPRGAGGGSDGPTAQRHPGLGPHRERSAMLLEQLDVFAAGVDGATMATAAVAYLDLARRELCYSLAGHVPPLLLTNGQPVRLDVARGAPLSIRLGRARPEATVRVEEGSTLLLYTDGLVERPGEDLAAGMERLGECLATALGRPDNRDRLHIEGICDRLVELASVGVPQHDDLAALCVRFASPSTDRLRIRLPAATAQLAPLRQRLREWLGSRGIAAADIDDLLVITGEAAANSIEHGYFHDWAAGELAVEVELHGTTVSCRVRDFGRWRYPPARGDRGRGLRLVRALAERVELTRGLQGTTLVIDYRCRDGSAPR